jgi:diaphanous 1
LRVHLSTAKLVWIEEFVNEVKGLDALGTLLSELVGKGGKRRALSDVESTVLLETVKCLRVLLNTEVRLELPLLNCRLLNLPSLDSPKYFLHQP